MNGELREACGVVAVVDNEQASQLCELALFSLQHRGQESAGIATIDDGRIHVEKAMGLVQEVLTPERMARLHGRTAIGHVRYSTTGASRPENAQPLFFRSRLGPFALEHNGNLVDAMSVRRQLEQQGAIFQTTTDSEVVAHVMARAQCTDLSKALVEALSTLHGGYALVVLTLDGVLAARDPFGIRPLVLGRLDGRACVASETCAFDAIGASFEREVQPGEILRIDLEGQVETLVPGHPHQERLCAFELIYFARPDSRFGGDSVQAARRRLGGELAHEAPAAADVVVGAPDSSLPAATGFAETLGLKMELALVKNRYVGRTFINPQQKNRSEGVRRKLSVIAELVAGKRVALIDDSLVRGTTARHMVQLLRQAGATAVHVRIASPPYRHPCHYGIDTSNRGELLAADRSTEDLRREISADSLAFLSTDGVKRATGRGQHCLACFNGDYPVPVADLGGKLASEVGGMEVE